MIKQMTDLPPGTLGFSAYGQVTAADYENVIVPEIEAAFALSPKVRLIYQIGPDFSGFDAGAMWDDAKLGLRHIRGWDRVALVTDVGWIRATAHVFGFAVPGEFHLFRNDQLDEAKRWINEPRKVIPTE